MIRRLLIFIVSVPLAIIIQSGLIVALWKASQIINHPKAWMLEFLSKVLHPFFIGIPILLLISLVVSWGIAKYIWKRKTA